MKWLLPFLLCTVTLAQHGPHRKIFTSISPIVCADVPAMIVESQTDGEIGIGPAAPTVTMASPFLTNDYMIAVAVNNQGISVGSPVIADTLGLTWTALIINDNQAAWFVKLLAPAANDTVHVSFVTHSLNRSLTVTHITGIPSVVTNGSTGAFPNPTTVLNATNVVFTYGGSGGSHWVFGALGVPSTALPSSGLIFGALASYDGTTFGLPEPSPWHLIELAGLPSAQIVYSCAP